MNWRCATSSRKIVISSYVHTSGKIASKSTWTQSCLNLQKCIVVRLALHARFLEGYASRDYDNNLGS